MNIDKLIQLCNKEGVSAAARILGVSRQAVHKRVFNHPDYKPQKKPQAPRCPKCDDTETWNRGDFKNYRQYSCINCGYFWREKIAVQPLSEVLENNL